MRTMGADAMCEKTWEYFTPRSQYRLSMLYPTPEAKGPDCCHRLGDSVHDWSTLKGGRKKIGIDNYVYMLYGDIMTVASVLIPVLNCRRLLI
jgi:conjugal transfer pilus assembly protein TraU